MKKVKISIRDAVLFYRENKDKYSMTSVGKIYGVDRHTISKNLEEDFSTYLYEDNDFIYRLDAYQEEAIQEYLKADGELPLSYFSEKYRLKTDTMHRLFKIVGIDYQRYYKVKFNREAFSSIETEADAYWLGFLLADGYNNTERYSLTLKLGEVDRRHLEKFAIYMGADATHIKEDVGGGDRPVYYVNFNDKLLSQRLESLGIKNNKSGKELFNKNIKLELWKHYIRGIVDGDGGLHFDLNKRNKIYFQLVGSNNLLKDVHSYIHNNIIPLEFEYIYPKGVIYELFIRKGGTVCAIVEHLYRDATVYLDRKKEVANALAVYKSEKEAGTLYIDWESEVKDEPNNSDSRNA